MALSDSDLEFLKDNHGAAMITVGDDGRPKAVRMGVVLVDGKLWSSATADRVRTDRLRRDPRCTLFVFGPQWEWLTIEANVRILEGPDVPRLSVQLFRAMQNRPTGPLSWFGGDLDDEAFMQAMVDEHRVIYELAVERTYGMS
jgi:PPOX class probable F420-dependent enzyme